MSWQKCMSILKCSNLEDKKNFENRAFPDGFLHLKIKIQAKFKLKTKLTKTTIKKSILYESWRIFSAFKRRLNF